MENGNTQAAIQAGQQIADAKSRITEVAGIPVVIAPPGTSADLLTAALEAADKRADAPRRRKGTATHSELSSFIAHVNRFKDEDSAIYADVDAVRLTCVFDYHRKGAGDPRWGEHRSVYACPLSKSWLLWTANDGSKMSQDQFAQFIEDNMQDLASPVGNGEDKDLPMPSEVLTMARNLVIRSKGEFSRSLNPVTGEHSLVCKNENETTSTKIPRAFLLGIPVFEAGAMYRVEARMRLDMSSGRPVFSYSIYQPEAIKRDAFGEARQMVTEQTALPLFAGNPE